MGFDATTMELICQPFNICPGCRYVDNGNGTVTDTLTVLVWLKDGNCFGLQNWNDATASAAAPEDGKCGLTDGSTAMRWRLPAEREWVDTVDTALNTVNYASPTLTTNNGNSCFGSLVGPGELEHAFQNVQQSDFYWSSTDQGMNAFRMSLVDGTVTTSDQASGHRVWPVREP